MQLDTYDGLGDKIADGFIVVAEVGVSDGVNEGR